MLICKHPIMNEDPKHTERRENEPDHIEGPAGAHVDFEGIEKSSPLYPLDKDAERSGSDPGFLVEDLGINSDGTNPGTEYEAPEGIKPDTQLPAITDLDENEPER